MYQKRQQKIPAMYIRGGTSKGVFFQLTDLPESAQLAGPKRDELLLRVIGSPDPYGKQTDGMGGATSSTSKVVIVSASRQPGHDVDYLFGQVSIDQHFIDWSGNCGNLTAAVGVFAIEKGLVDLNQVSANGYATIKIWQANIQKTIIANIPVENGSVQEIGDFELDGVTFPSAEIPISFLDPADGEGDMFPTGNVSDLLEVPTSIASKGQLSVTLINSGIPTIFVNAKDLGLTGIELQSEINEDPLLLSKFEQIRAIGALKMGLIASIDEARVRQHTPKIAFVSPSQPYLSSSNKEISEQSIDIVVRALSMGKLHHAMMGTAAVAIASAAAVPGTLVNAMLKGTFDKSITFGHPSGTLSVGANAVLLGDKWLVNQVTMSRSARILMDGHIRVPLDF